MTEQEIKLVIGGLLHDIGKVIYRTGDGRAHSKSGYDFLTEETGIMDKEKDREMLHSVLYHHASSLKDAKISQDSNAYITYMADNIASAADRRKKENEDYGFEMAAPLRPVFNILNGNEQDKYYHPMMLDGQINYPTEEKMPFDEHFYTLVKQKLTEALSGIRLTEEYVNSLLETLESTLSYVPSSTSKSEIADISLYDHMKLTAAIGSCIYQYLKENEITDYKAVLLDQEKEFYEKPAFLLYSMDVSGIQDFIYTIQSKDALKMLRARSFYLEIIMEHVVDALLAKLNLSRANLIYAGGGHCYLLLPNTKNVIEEVKHYEMDVNKWFLEQFDVALYVAFGYTKAAANDFKNIPEGSYAELYHSVSEMISRKKRSRYGAEDIMRLNQKQLAAYSQECSVCKKLTDVNEDGLCHICASLRDASKDILFKPFFVVVSQYEEHALPLPGNCYLIAASEKEVKERMKQSDSYVRVYGKNEYYTGVNLASKVWVGDYTKGQTFEELADASEGIHRIGVLRADVDNLGQTFVGGFSSRYNTLSRTAALSRELSLFFKYYINGILEQGQYHIEGFYQNKSDKKERNATIIYSGGDDVFIVGAWNETIELSIDIQAALARYTENTLSISAGIGIYDSKYPISCIAGEVGELEDISKKMKGKASVTLFPAGRHGEKNDDGEMVMVSDGTYHWEVFLNDVVKSKYSCLKDFFSQSEDRGKSFLYHLLFLIRGQGDRINFARYVYLLSRMEPDIHALDWQREKYRKFSRQMYEWIKNEEDCRQLCTAMNLYAYLVRT